MTNTFTLIEFWVMNHKSAKPNRLNVLCRYASRNGYPNIKQLIMSKFLNRSRATNKFMNLGFDFEYCTACGECNIDCVKSILLLNTTELLRNNLFDRITITPIGGWHLQKQKTTRVSKLEPLLYPSDSALPVS